MVVLQIQTEYVAAFDPECDPVVSGDRHRPFACTFSLERMQAPARDIEAIKALRCFALAWLSTKLLLESLFPDRLTGEGRSVRRYGLAFDVLAALCLALVWSVGGRSCLRRILCRRHYVRSALWFGVGGFARRCRLQSRNRADLTQLV